MMATPQPTEADWQELDRLLDNIEPPTPPQPQNRSRRARVSSPELVPGIRWDDLPDDLSKLARMALDLRLSWDDPEDPWAVAARIKHAEMERRNREAAYFVRHRPSPTAQRGTRRPLRALDRVA